MGPPALALLQVLLTEQPELRKDYGRKPIIEMVGGSALVLRLTATVKLLAIAQIGRVSKTFLRHPSVNGGGNSEKMGF